MARRFVGLKNRLSTQTSGGLSGVRRHNYLLAGPPVCQRRPFFQPADLPDTNSESSRPGTIAP